MSPEGKFDEVEKVILELGLPVTRGFTAVPRPRHRPASRSITNLPHLGQSQTETIETEKEEDRLVPVMRAFAERVHQGRKNTGDRFFLKYTGDLYQSRRSDPSIDEAIEIVRNEGLLIKDIINGVIAVFLDGTEIESGSNLYNRLRWRVRHEIRDIRRTNKK